MSFLKPKGNKHLQLIPYTFIDKFANVIIFCNLWNLVIREDFGLHYTCSCHYSDL